MSVVAVLALAACGTGSAGVAFDTTTPTMAPPATISAPSVSVTTIDAPTTGSIAVDGTFELPIDVDHTIREISPLIRGVSGAPADYLTAIGATVDSWGGNAANRYDFRSNSGWNAGRSWEFRNDRAGLAADGAAGLLQAAAEGDAAARLTVPTLGWVARNGERASCSFPTADGGCDGFDDASCSNPTVIADPNRTSVASTPADVTAWVSELIAQGLPPAVIAVGNEPELAGDTHYDVHPTCPSYEEILATYTAYADPLSTAAPAAMLAGPVMCCWYSTWLTSPGPTDGGPQDFLTWFLTRLREHDASIGRRTIDLLDVHYYPQSEVYNDAVDADTAARRLRSTKSLFDTGYRDESWVRSNIALVPRLRQMIDRVYPGTGLAVSEWNFGADGSINGALAIADVLGIYGREGVDMAAYWQYPQPESPGFFAFKMHGNYDGNGGAFEGTSVPIGTPDVDRLSAFAAIDGGVLKVMLVNKDSTPLPVQVQTGGFDAAPNVAVYSYGQHDPAAIVPSTAIVDGDEVELTLDASSITLIEVRPA